MGRSAICCDEKGLKKGPWTAEEDEKLVEYVERYGHGRSTWRAVPKLAGLKRCGKSCRLRWTNYLRPDIKRGNFSHQEQQTIIHLHALLGNKWSAIATSLPRRTDNEIKNFWNTHLKKKLLQMGIDPVTHMPLPTLLTSTTHDFHHYMYIINSILSNTILPQLLAAATSANPMINPIPWQWDNNNINNAQNLIASSNAATSSTSPQPPIGFAPPALLLQNPFYTAATHHYHHQNEHHDQQHPLDPPVVSTSVTDDHHILNNMQYYTPITSKSIDDPNLQLGSLSLSYATNPSLISAPSDLHHHQVPLLFSPTSVPHRTSTTAASVDHHPMEAWGDLNLVEYHDQEASNDQSYWKHIIDLVSSGSVDMANLVEDKLA